MAPTASPFVTSLGSFTALATELGYPMFMLGEGLLNYTILSDWLAGNIGPVTTLYLATAMGLIVELCAAGYMIYKVTQSVISFVDGYAYLYRGGSIVGNQIGQYEVLYVALYYGSAATLIFVAFAGAVNMWETLQNRELGATEGFLGVAVPWTTMIKFLAMGSAVLISTYYSVYSIGETVDQLIGWFDEWSDDERNEATQQNGSAYIDGTAFIWDVQLHAVHVVASWLVFNFIIFAGHWLAGEKLNFTELQGCDLDGVDASYYSDVLPLIATELDIPSCKVAVKQIFRIADLDKDGHISRCENAKFLYGMGNSQKYALNYNEERSLALLYKQICYARFKETDVEHLDEE